MDSSIQIEGRASQWLAKRDSGNWSASDALAFAAWLDESKLHVVAFVRLEAAWIKTKRLKALAGGLQPGEMPSPAEWVLSPLVPQVSAPKVAEAHQAARSSVTKLCAGQVPSAARSSRAVSTHSGPG